MSFGCIPVYGIAEPFCSNFSFVRTLHIDLHNGFTTLYSYQSHIKAPAHPHLLHPHLLQCLLLFIFLVVVILLSLVTKDIKYIIWYLLVIYMFSFDNGLFNSLAHFLMEESSTSVLWWVQAESLPAFVLSGSPVYQTPYRRVAGPVGINPCNVRGWQRVGPRIWPTCWLRAIKPQGDFCIWSVLGHFQWACFSSVYFPARACPLLPSSFSSLMACTLPLPRRAFFHTGSVSDQIKAPYPEDVPCSQVLRVARF